MPSRPSSPPPLSLPPTTVFVYGTLMPGERNAHVAARGGTFSAQPATLPGYALFHLLPEAYPGVVPSPGALVRGYALTYRADGWAATLPFLDELEGVDESPPLYTRERAVVALQGGTPQEVWVYVYADAARLARPGVVAVPGGDWRRVAGRERPEPLGR